GTAATRERHGIFVGNFISLCISENQIEAQRSGFTGDMAAEGIRISGFAGVRMIVKENHLDRFDTGIAFLTKSLPTPRLWLITGNFALNAAVTLAAFRKVRRSLVDIRSQIRGATDNLP